MRLKKTLETESPSGPSKVQMWPKGLYETAEGTELRSEKPVVTDADKKSQGNS